MLNESALGIMLTRRSKLDKSQGQDTYHDWSPVSITREGKTHECEAAVAAVAFRGKITS